MTHSIVETTVSSAVASGGTITFSYPSGRDAGFYENTRRHKLWSAGLQTLFDYIDDFTIAFGATVVVTYNGSTSIPAGTDVSLQLDESGLTNLDDPFKLGSTERTALCALAVVSLGAPDTADVDGLIEAYTGSTPALDGALVSGGVGAFDVPRNIVVDSGGADTAVLTFTGTDEYGNTVVESITLNGTTAVAGKKAFKTVTAVSSSAAIANGAFAGPGDVLGLPFRLPDAGYVVKELEDGAAPTAGTLVAGVDTAATATTGDVRGTYDPNSACNGSKSFKLLIAAVDPEDRGVAQYAG